MNSQYIPFFILISIILLGLGAITYFAYQSHTHCDTWDISAFERVDSEHYNCCKMETTSCRSNGRGGCYLIEERVCEGEMKR